MGLGRFGGGVDVVRFAHDAGAKITVTDTASAEKLADSLKQLADLDGIEYRLGSHTKPDFEQADIIIANPAVPPENEFLEIARRLGKTITSQVEILFQLCPATIIGITGANGKSTTTALTAHLLKNTQYATVVSEVEGSRNTHYKAVYLTGNIGNEPFLCLLEQIKTNDLVVIELSSFQIEQMARSKKMPQIALLTNLTPNHLDRYGTFEKYCAAKELIFQFQKLDKKNPAVSIFNADDPIANKWFEKYKNDTGRICIKFSASDVPQEIKNFFQLPGWANIQNLAAALSITRHLGLPDEQVQKSVSTFKALPHRLELVAEKNGVRWYNDSKATTPDSAITALQAFDKPTILIAGGYDKHIPFDTLGVEIAKRAKAAVLIGQTAQKIADAIKSATENKEEYNFGHREHPPSSRLRRAGREHREKLIIKKAKSLEEAIHLAYQVAESGDVVLLSPACASYDMFENYEHRGREFTRLVKQKQNK